ncbi:MAG TPA: restriction endonuclease subunit S [Thermoanaerobaculia bacterium]|nr:restriction endonuclease subunit S [Thermoanaerobaculia bacterium]
MTSAVSDWESGRRAGELPEGWAEATLEAIVVHKLGGDWGLDPEAAETDPDLVRVRMIRGTEFREWARDKGSTAEARAVKRSSLAKRRLAPGDLVVEISGGGVSQPVGRTLLIDEEALRRADAPLICNNFCRQVRIHREIDPAFVHLALSHLYLCGGVDEYQTQTTNLRNLNFTSFLAGVILPLPPFAEQGRIVDKVRELMEPVRRAREGLARLPAILRRFRQSVLAAAYSGKLTEEWREEQPGPPESLEGLLVRSFELRRAAWEKACDDAEAFGRRAPRRPKNLDVTEWEAPEPLEAPEVPEGWRVAALHDVIHRAQYGVSVKAEAKPRTGIAILRMVNIRAGRMDGSALKYVDRKKVDVPAFTVRRGDILFNRTNSAELVGKAAVYDLDLEAVFASYLVRIECDEDLAASRYVCGWINSPWGRRWARTVRTDCSNQSNINVSRLQTMPVPVPPLAEQHEIVRRIGELLAFAGAVEKRVAKAEERAEKLQRTILARALRGELVPTEAELARADGSYGPSGSGFEPASDLLERIEAERSGLVAMGAGPAGEVSERILTAVRQACWGSGEMTREELIRKVADRLGCPKFGRTVRARLEAHVEAAVARRIAVRKGELLTGATPTFGRYDFRFLMATARSLFAPGVELEKEEIVRAIAAYLGYGQVTVAIRDRMERVFQWAAQGGEIEVREGRVRLP